LSGSKNQKRFAVVDLEVVERRSQAGNAKPESPSDLVEYDFDRSPTLTVPGDWNSQRESLLFYEGTVWYKTSFDDPRRDDSRLFVYFGAANYRARVYLNGPRPRSDPPGDRGPGASLSRRGDPDDRRP